MDDDRDYKRIYKGERDDTVAKAIRKFVGNVGPMANEAGEFLLSRGGGPFHTALNKCEHHELEYDFRQCVRFIQDQYNRRFGPVISLHGKRNAPLGKAQFNVG